MMTSIHTVEAGVTTMANDMEARPKDSPTGGKEYSIVTGQIGTPTEVYNAEGEEERSRRLNMNGINPTEKENEVTLQKH